MPRSSYDIALSICEHLSLNDVFNEILLGTDQKNHEPLDLSIVADEVVDDEVVDDEAEEIRSNHLIVYPISSVEDEGHNEVDIYFQYTVRNPSVTTFNNLKIYEGLKTVSDIEQIIFGLKHFNSFSGRVVDNEILPVENFPFFLGYTVLRYRFPITIK